MKDDKSAVLVTGGSAGIGDAICRRLHHEDYHVINLDVQEPASPQACEFVEIDMFDKQKLHETLLHIVEQHAVTRLVNNVGIVRPAACEDASLQDFDDLMSLNVKSTLQCTQALLPTMRSCRFGRIVTISSRAALGKPLRANYSASKAALIGMSKTLALELAGDGITVNIVAPGSIGTEAFFRNNSRESPRTKAILRGIPVGHIGDPEDVAHAVSFFMDARSGFITGQVLYVCGGMTVGQTTG